MCKLWDQHLLTSHSKSRSISFSNTPRNNSFCLLSHWISSHKIPHCRWYRLHSMFASATSPWLVLNKTQHVVVQVYTRLHTRTRLCCSYPQASFWNCVDHVCPCVRGLRHSVQLYVVCERSNVGWGRRLTLCPKRDPNTFWVAIGNTHNKLPDFLAVSHRFILFSCIDFCVINALFYFQTDLLIDKCWQVYSFTSMFLGPCSYE